MSSCSPSYPHHHNCSCWIVFIYLNTRPEVHWTVCMVCWHDTPATPKAPPLWFPMMEPLKEPLCRLENGTLPLGRLVFAPICHRAGEAKKCVYHMSDWLRGLWRLTSPHICRSSPLETQESWYSFHSEGQQAQAPEKADLSAWVQWQKKTQNKTPKTLSQLEGSQGGGILPYLKKDQTFCSIQASN